MKRKIIKRMNNTKEMGNMKKNKLLKNGKNVKNVKNMENAKEAKKQISKRIQLSNNNRNNPNFNHKVFSKFLNQPNVPHLSPKPIPNLFPIANQQSILNRIQSSPHRPPGYSYQLRANLAVCFANDP